MYYWFHTEVSDILKNLLCCFSALNSMLVKNFGRSQWLLASSTENANVNQDNRESPTTTYPASYLLEDFDKVANASLKVSSSMEGSTSLVLNAGVLMLAAAAAGGFAFRSHFWLYFVLVLTVFVLVFVCSPQSRSSRTSVKSTTGSRGGGSWKGPSIRLRPVAPVMPPVPVPPSTLPVPHQVGEFTAGCTHTHKLLFMVFTPKGHVF